MSLCLLFALVIISMPLVSTDQDPMTIQYQFAPISVPCSSSPNLQLLWMAVIFLGRRGGRLSKTERWLMCWWVYTGLTHLIVTEGAFAFSPKFFSNQNPFFFDEVWKVFSKGDSRCVARDPATVTVSRINTLLLGPASLLAVYAIASRKSYSHIIQFTVCLGQLYGNMVYYTTAYLGGFNFWASTFYFWASTFYFWAYFIRANNLWLVMPTLIAIRSWKKICAALQVEKVKTK